MLQFEELIQKLHDLKPDLDDLEDALDVKAMRNEIRRIGS